MVNLSQIRIYVRSTAAQNVYISVFLKILTSLMYLVLVPFAIRSIGADKYGIAAFFLTMHGYMSLLDSGFTYALGLQYTRKIVHDPDEAKKIFFSAIPIYLFLSAVGILLFLLFKDNLSQMAFNSTLYSKEMLLFGFIMAITVIDSMINTVLQAHEKINLIASGRFLLDLVKVAGVMMLGLTHMAPELIVWFILLSVAVKLIYNFYFFKKIILQIKIIFELKAILETFKLALPSVAIAVCSLFMSMLDKFLVSGKISTGAFTSYSFAIDLTTKAYFLMYAVTTVIYPKLIKEHSQGNSLVKLVKVQLLALLLICFFYYIPLAVLSDFIVQVLLGQDLVQPTADLIKICSLSAVLYLFFSILESYLNSIGAVSKTLLVYITGIISFVFLLDFFLQRYQLFGVAIAVSTMFLVMIAVSGIFIVSMRKRFWHG